MSRDTGALLAGVTYLAAAVAANVLTHRYGVVPVGFGLEATAGTFAAGFVLLARDVVQRTWGAAMTWAFIVTGGALSAILASPALALASVTAFLLAEVVDLAVFTPLRRRGFIRAALVSNTAAAPVDTVVFLLVAGFPITAPVVAGQLVGKLAWATLIPLALYAAGRRALSRQPVDA